MKKGEMKKFGGQCVGLVEGKIVINSTSINKVIKELNKYPDKKVRLMSIPKGDKIFIL